MRYWLKICGILCMLLLLLGGCGKDTATRPQEATPETKPTEVRVGVLRLTSSAPIFIGIEKGFFAEENIQVKPMFFDAAQPIAVATAADEIDVGATGLTAGLYNLAAGGKAPLIVADKGRESADHPASFLVVNKAAYDAGIHDVRALVGKKIGNTQAGSTYQYMMGNILERNGLAVDSVHYANLGKMSTVMAALQSQQIDAAILNEPHASLMANAGYVVPLQAVGSHESYQVSALFYAPKFAGNEDLAIRFMRAYIKSCQYYYDTIFDETRADDPMERLQKDHRFSDLIAIIGKYTMTPDKEIVRSLPFIDRNGKPDTSDIAKQVQWYAAHGFIPQPPALEKIVNTAYWQKAYDSLEKAN